MHETCAQTLGTVLHHLPKEGVWKVLAVLIKLQGQEQWQVRHGGLLGLKYMLAVRKVGRGMKLYFNCWEEQTMDFPLALNLYDVEAFPF